MATIDQVQSLWISITTWLEGKKTVLCGVGFMLSLVATATCYWLKLVTLEQAVQLLVLFSGVFGGGSTIFQRQATAKLQRQIDQSRQGDGK
jgi:hypothetical protein